MSEQPHVVILGGGFGGLEAAKKLEDADCTITLVDRNNHHLFQPLLYQVATAGLSQPEIASPIRSELRTGHNTSIRMDEVTAVDLPNRTVKLKKGDISYDFLVIALGAENGYFGNDHWADYTLGLKSLDQAIAIRRNVLYAYEKAEMCADPEEQKRLMTTVVVGGGPTGVEMAGALIELARHVINRDFRNIDPLETRVILIEASPKILGQFSDPLPEKAKKALEEMGVEVRVNTPVKDIREGEVILENETIQATSIIWGAGVQAPKLTRDMDVPLDRGGRILIEPDCSLPSHPNVFAIGDIVSLTDARGKRVPGVSPAAIQMGDYVAEIIRREVASGEKSRRTPFVYFDKGSMATIGRSQAIAELGPMKMTGFLAWLMWLAVHLLFLIGFRNKVAVLVQWFYAYIRYKHGARIITGLQTDPA
ncbi:MAG: NAD(P)/FAD-dependent oxidoreductase [Verrucomicrobiota bacterium]